MIPLHNPFRGPITAGEITAIEEVIDGAICMVVPESEDRDRYLTMTLYEKLEQ
jgi:hypothetical protein